METPNLPEKETEIVDQPTQTPEQPNPPTVAKPEDTVDFWKQKFSESSREANLLREAEAKRKRSEQELTTQPTDSELRSAFPEWDTLTDFEKRMARETIEAKRIAGSAAAATTQMREDREWNTGIELAVASDSALQGKEHEFRQFASRPQYRGVPMDILKDSFLQRTGTKPVQPVTPPTPRPGLEPGSGGPRTPEKPKTLSGDDLKRLRDSDPKAYAEYVKTHDIEID